MTTVNCEGKKRDMSLKNASVGLKSAVEPSCVKGKKLKILVHFVGRYYMGNKEIN